MSQYFYLQEKPFLYHSLFIQCNPCQKVFQIFSLVYLNLSSVKHLIKAIGISFDCFGNSHSFNPVICVFSVMSANCENCFESYSNKDNAKRHQKTCFEFVCRFCWRLVSGDKAKGEKGYRQSRIRHEKKCEYYISYICNFD